jgi:hypothetical protein
MENELFWSSIREPTGCVKYIAVHKTLEFTEEVQERDLRLDNTSMLFKCSLNEPSHYYIISAQNIAWHIVCVH